MKVPRAFPHPARPKIAAASDGERSRDAAPDRREARPLLPIAPAPSPRGPRCELAIESSPPLQHSLFGEDEGQFFTDAEETDVHDA
eukprot:5490969-Pyramimonas_sp.AAC.1